MSDVIDTATAMEADMEPLERAKADLKKLQSELLRAQLQVGHLEQKVAKVQAYIEMAPVYEAEASDDEQQQGRRTSVAAQTVKAAISILSDAGRRMPTRDLLEALAERGVTVGGNNPAGNLSGFLSRSDELHNSRSEGWGLVDWSKPTEAPPSKAGELLEQLSQIAEQLPPVPEPKVKRAVINPEIARQWEPSADLDDEIPF